MPLAPLPAAATALAEQPDGADEHAAERAQDRADAGRRPSTGRWGRCLRAGALRAGARLAGVRLDVALPLRGRVVVDVRLAMGRTLPPRTTRHSRHRAGHAAGRGAEGGAVSVGPGQQVQ
jgi:hypothetical protein